MMKVVCSDLFNNSPPYDFVTWCYILSTMRTEHYNMDIEEFILWLKDTYDATLVLTWEMNIKEFTIDDASATMLLIKYSRAYVGQE